MVLFSLWISLSCLWWSYMYYIYIHANLKTSLWYIQLRTNLKANVVPTEEWEDCTENNFCIQQWRPLQAPTGQACGGEKICRIWSFSFCTTPQMSLLEDYSTMSAINLYDSLIRGYKDTGRGYESTFSCCLPVWLFGTGRNTFALKRGRTTHCTTLFVWSHAEALSCSN